MLSLAATVLAAMSFFGSVNAQSGDASCRNMPGDAGWPSPATWASLNSTVGGRLIQTVPVASVCHHGPIGTFDVDRCEEVRNNWDNPGTYEYNPAEVMNPIFQNDSCTPFTPASQPCDLGNYPSYSIHVTGAEDAQAGIKFAKDNNIRLIIKNTGHDFAGKSTGAGSLSLWTHNMNETTVIENYNGSTYQGPAAKLQTGAIAGYVYPTLAAAGYRIIGGSCLSVGLAGGYTPGGGHSLLNSLYGMASDAVLEWEVVTAEGQHLIATPSQNSDLYWALSGGGAGTYAVAISMTTKIFPETQIGSGALRFNDSTVGNTTFWQGVGDLLAFYPTVGEIPGGMDFEVANNSLLANNIVIPNKTPEQITELFSPLLSQLEERGIPYTFEPESFDSYYAHIEATLSPLPFGPYPSGIQLTTRLIRRDSVSDPEQLADIIEALRAPIETGYYGIGCRALNVKDIEHPDNAVLPEWRDATALCNLVGYWDWSISTAANQARKEDLVGQILPTIDAATPGAGSYLNEIEYEYRGDWKKELYGVNYDRLLEIKDKYDPDHLLYGHFAVGMEYWSVADDGRLCQA